MTRICEFVHDDGRSCEATPMSGEDNAGRVFCFYHSEDPAVIQQHQEAVKRGGRQSGKSRAMSAGIGDPDAVAPKDIIALEGILLEEVAHTIRTTPAGERRCRALASLARAICQVSDSGSTRKQLEELVARLEGK